MVMARVTSEDIRDKLQEIHDFIGKKYALDHPKKDRDWRTYEQQFSLRIKTAMRDLSPLIDEAVSSLHIIPAKGHPHALALQDRLRILLIKELVGESNRMFANMLDLFAMLSGVDISYKSVERLYSDEEVMLAIHNLHSLVLRKKGVANASGTGDGTGYSLTVKKNYESHAQKLKDKAKENPGTGNAKGDGKHKKRLFAYSFRLLDLDSGMYIAFGSSVRSEREAFDRSMAMLKTLGINLDSVRLDRYYSSSSYVDRFGCRVFIIPKKNATLNGSAKWKTTMKEFVEDTMHYLEEYHQRSLSESAFAADKKMLGWNVAQKRDDRIDSALFCSGLWHNLFNLAP